MTTISLTSPLPTLGINDSINGMTPSGRRVTIDGASAGRGANGLTLNHLPKLGAACYTAPGYDRTANNISNLIIINFSAHGIDGMSVQGGSFQGLDIFGNGGSGIFLHAVICRRDWNALPGSRNVYFPSHSNLIGGSQASQRNFIFSNGGHGIDIDVDPSFPNPAAHNNRIEGNFIGSGNPPGGAGLGLLNNGNRLTGVHLRNVRGSVVGGDNPAMSNLISESRHRGFRSITK